MKKNRWQEITDLYHAAVNLPENERADFLETCPDDDIRREVQSLLANEKEVHSVFQSSAVDAAAKVGIKPRDSLAGKELGSYQLTSEIGRGGMGEVYRAKDQKLGRDVAIKVLPEEFAVDADRVARFQQEARTLASLNHPNIAAIHGLEASGGIHFLVLELVEGETLADRLQRGPVPVEEALQLALQIAEALEAAHGKHVIHRDLKPANISVDPDGKVKVLDFGLAKALNEEQQTSVSDSPTVSAAATLHGVILGTAAYMSPEQARGKAVDKRADIWAFGCVLYEMLSGRPVFSGDTVSDLLSAVIRAEPDWSSLPANLHWRLREVIQRCLAKDPRNRYHDISDVRLDIQKALADPGGLPVPVAAAGRRLPLRWTIAAMVLTGLIAGAVVWNLKQIPPPEPGPVVRFDYKLPEAQRAEIDISQPTQRVFILAVSRDGTQFVYCTRRGLYLRSLHGGDARLIPGTGENPVSPFFSPDGKWIGYFSPTENQLKKVAVAGGTPIPLAHPVAQVLGAEWCDDNTIIYADGKQGIWRVPEEGGTPEKIVEGHLALPQLLPDGKSILFTDTSPTLGFKIMVESLESHKRKELLTAEWARYLPTGHLVFGRLFWTPEPETYTVSFNPETLEQTGGRVPLPELATAVLPAISNSGTVVFFPGIRFREKGALVWVDRNGKEEQIPVPPNYYGVSRVSPDGTKMTTVIGSANTDIYIYDFVGQAFSRLTSDESIDSLPAWTPNGSRIAFRSNRNGEGIYWTRADGNGEVEMLLPAPKRVGMLYPNSFSPDGETLAYTAVSDSTDEDIWMLPLNGKREGKLLLQTKYGESDSAISPDGRFLAYSSDESGRSEVYIRSFPDMKRQCPVSTNGGQQPIWCRTCKELFYRNGDAFLAVSVETTGPDLKLGTPRELFSRKYVEGFWHISPDGKRFLLGKNLSPAGKPAAQDLLHRINIILNWSEELKQRIPSR